MIKDSFKELRKHLCGGAYASLSDICEEVVSLCTDCGAEDGPLLLRAFLEDITLSDLAGGELTEEFLRIDSERMTSFQEFLTLENRVVSNLTQARVSEVDFYRSLWDKLNDQTLISNRGGKMAFLFSLRIDNRIPYFELEEGCMMDEDRYKELVDKLRPAIAKGSFILSTNLKYKTQRASLLMDVAKGLADEDERTVFWAVLLGRIRAIQRLQKQEIQMVPSPPQTGSVQEQ